ncbi:MAG: hypothetical protein HY741_15310 [Chloroflexi bacterium]|nr:hypothetical protein [Chloroflexota bacterium]
MSPNDPPAKQTAPRGVRRIPQQSFVYDRVVPIVMIGLAIVMVIILIIAAAILLGLVRL